MKQIWKYVPKRSQIAAAFVAVILGLSTVHAAGFRKLEFEGLHMGVWYPSDTPTTLHRLGPFETKMARDAPVQVGQHQLVLLSHGIGGRYRNHYLTAQALADSGYMVIAPQHEADDLVFVGGSKLAQALDHRYTELAKALQVVRKDAELRDHIATSPVHGVGYSLGGATIMLAAGAGFSSEQVAQYCREKEDLDPEYCEAPAFIYRMIQSFQDDSNLRPKRDPFRNPPLVTGKAILVAPAFQGLDLEQPLAMADLTVIAIGGDRIAKPEFHAKPLAEAAAQQVPTRFKTVQGHHYAFIAPFPKWLTDKEDIPVAKDPEGFNRPAFLQAVNKIILDVLPGS